MGKTALFKGRIRNMVTILVVNDNDDPLPNTKFKVVFKNNQSIEVQSNSEGKLLIPMRAKGKLKFELLEENL